LINDWPDEALAAEPLTGRSAFLALAHDPKLDDAALAVALRSPAGYIGALGSARSHARRMVRLAELGFTPPQLARIYVRWAWPSAPVPQLRLRLRFWQN
jgi:xanthine dehydrogenase accessory factor